MVKVQCIYCEKWFSSLDHCSCLEGRAIDPATIDPVAALEAFDLGMIHHDRIVIHKAAMDIVNWLENGGYMPVGPNSADWRGKLTANQLASYFRMARDMAKMP